MEREGISHHTAQGKESTYQEVRVRRHAYAPPANAAGKEGLEPQDQESLACSGGYTFPHRKDDSGHQAQGDGGGC